MADLLNNRCQLISYLLFVVLLALIESTTTTTHEDGTTAALKSVVQLCTNKLEAVKSIREFKLFMRQLELVQKHGLQVESLDTAKPASKKEKEQFQWCLAGVESLRQLEQLVDQYDKVRPCKYSEIHKLELFARQFFVVAKGKSSKSSPALRFFTLFGVNIGINCKLNLLAHLRQADLEADPMDFIYSMASPTGWNVLINEQTKKSMKFGTSSQASNQIVHKIARLIPGLSQIEQLDYLNFNHLMNDQQVADAALNQGIESGEYQFQQTDEQDGKSSSLSHHRKTMVESLEKIVKSCQNLDQFYVNSLLSLAKLNELGLVVDYLNEFHEPSLAQHKWLAAASFCQLMIRVRLLPTNSGGGDATTIKFEILHNDQLLESRRQLYSYVAKFDEIGEQAKEMAWRASVSGGHWKQKSAAMFQTGQSQSMAMRQVKQYFKGVEQNFLAGSDE